MGIRDAINEKPFLTFFIALVAIVLALGFTFLRPRHHLDKLPTRSYYSDDDGKTWYIDDAKNVPPYDHNGKEAVRAYLYRCGSGKPFVHHLQKFEPGAKEIIDLQIQSGIPPLEAQMRTVGVDIKKPGAANWIHTDLGAANDKAAVKEVTEVHCPDGSPDKPLPVSVDENAPSP